MKIITMPKCTICGETKKKEELVDDICQDCASAILKEEEYDFGKDDFS
jgi:hypothetical protein